MSTKFAPLVRPLRYAVLAFLLVAVRGAAQEPPAKQVLVEINTTLGRMVVALYNETPLHRDNFVKLVRAHYYDSLLFHRVIPDFMVQGGDPDSRKAGLTEPVGNGGPGYTVPAEPVAGLIHTKGALAAARTDDQQNPTKASNGSQFYIVQGRAWTADEINGWAERKRAKDPNFQRRYTPEQIEAYVKNGGTPHLDGDYTVFGRVIEGMEVLDQLAKVPCNGTDRPLDDVRMWMRVIE